jgi:hypothetical protein
VTQVVRGPLGDPLKGTGSLPAPWVDGHDYDDTAYEETGLLAGGLVCANPESRVGADYLADQDVPPPGLDNGQYLGIGCAWVQTPYRAARVSVVWSGEWDDPLHLEASPLMHVTPGTSTHGIGAWTAVLFDTPTLMVGTIGNPPELFNVIDLASFEHTQGTEVHVELRSDGEGVTVWLDGEQLAMTSAGYDPVEIPTELKSSRLHGFAYDAHLATPASIPSTPVLSAWDCRALSDDLPTLTGGTAVDAEDDDGNWWRTLTFTSSGTLTFEDFGDIGGGVEAEWLVVDGGAAGGGPGGTVNRFGGGGAGGQVQTDSGPITASQTVTVGTGGTADSTPTTSPAQGGDGTASSLGTLTVGGVSGGGGDGGATASFNNGRTGVNGGGGGAVTVAGTGGASTGGGNAGGNGFPSATANLRAGGGGGSTAATGGNAASADGGDGGAGTEWPTSSGTFYGGGGGGSAGSGAAGSGGTGGGGAGALGTAASGTSGTANTGGGGGGCAGTGTPGAGGTGVVKVRFRIYP